MKITLTGSLGHIGKPLTQELVQKGHTVTVISSKADKQKEIEALGAIAAIGPLEDVDFLSATFTGADAVYTMVPPTDFFNPKIDLIEHYNRLGNNFAQAITKSGVKRVVHLSSIGAHMNKDSGLIMGHYDVETILNKLSDVAITFMRPVAFYYNLFGFVPAIKNAGMIASNYGGEDRAAWVSPIDIAAAIAGEIVKPLVGKKVEYVASDEPSCNEIASILGTAIGKPDLKWAVITDEQLQSGLLAIGMAPKNVTAFVEMNACIHNGKLYEDYHRHKPVLGKVKVKDFAFEFAAAFKQN